MTLVESRGLNPPGQAIPTIELVRRSTNLDFVSPEANQEFVFKSGETLPGLIYTKPSVYSIEEMEMLGDGLGNPNKAYSRKGVKQALKGLTQHTQLDAGSLADYIESKDGREVVLYMSANQKSSRNSR